MIGWRRKKQGHNFFPSSPPAEMLIVEAGVIALTLHIDTDVSLTPIEIFYTTAQRVYTFTIFGKIL